MPDHLSQKQRAVAVFAQAMELHRAGQVGEAVEFYRQALAADPEPAEVWRYLGDAERDCGDISAALEAFQKAIVRSPENAFYRAELATTLHGAGRLEDAGVAYHAALDRDPSDLISHNNLAGVRVALGCKDEVIEEYRKALQGDPGNVDIIINLGVTLREARIPSEAAELLRLVLKSDDVPARVHAALADACADLGDRATAIDEYRLALLYESGYAMPGAGASLGTLLQQEGRTQEAFAAYREAIRRDPKSVLALTNLGAILVEVGQTEEATSCLEMSVELDGNYAAAWGNLGNARQDQLRLEDARKAHARGLALEPENPDLHWNNAMTLLLNGDYEAGFEEYEWRLKMPKIAPRALTSPIWQGEDLVGASILLVAEQGLGDAIQFARFASGLAAKGARVTICCADSLEAFFSTLGGLEGVVETDDPIPDHDFHLPLMRTPHRLGVSQATIPGDTPYLKVPDGVTVPPSRETKHRIGLCWSGNPGHPSDRQRSCGLAILRPLLDRSDDEWVSLQFGPGTEAIVEEGLTDLVADWARYLHGFGNTAAAVDALDLIISIDFSTAHLAGVLGLPVWAMLKHVPDWRWRTDKETTPWYPTMRLFRQPEPGDWQGVVNLVAQALVEQK